MLFHGGNGGATRNPSFAMHKNPFGSVSDPLHEFHDLSSLVIFEKPVSELSYCSAS